MSKYSCGGCDDYEGDSKQAVRAHQANPHTDCTSDDEIIGEEADNSSENTESDHVGQGNTDGSTPEDGKTEEEVPENPENDDPLERMTYEPNRDNDGDLFDRSETEVNTEEDTDDQEEQKPDVYGDDEDQDDTDDGEKGDVEEADDVEIDSSLAQVPHILLNKALRKIGEKKGYQVAELDDDAKQQLGQDTKTALERKLEPDTLEKLDSGGLWFRMAKEHLATLFGTSEQGEPDEEASSDDENPEQEEEEEKPPIPEDEEDDSGRWTGGQSPI